MSSAVRAVAGAKLLLGSHVETQPHAGWLDGALGVIYGLEVARTLGGGIDVAAWADEEGHFGSFIGSRSFCGLLSEAEIDACHDREGTTLRDALAQAGFAGRPRAEVDPARYRGYLEAHIEQGAELEDTGKRIGIVTAIVGSHRFRIVFDGVQNHAGTTRMAVRKDAGVALVKLASAIYQRFPEVAGPRTVWTTGRILLDPGAPSIVPGHAEMLFQFRDTDPTDVGKAGCGTGSAGGRRDARTVQGDHRRTRELGAAGDGRRFPGCAGTRGGATRTGAARAHAEWCRA